MYTKEDVGPRYRKGAPVELSDEEKQAIADEWNRNAEVSADEWLARIATERERRLNTSIPVTLSDGDYVVPVTDRAAAQAPEAARRARADTEDKTRPFPADKGIVERSPDDLDAIGDVLDTYMKKVWRRTGDLQDKVDDGSITQEDIETGWP